MHGQFLTGSGGISGVPVPRWSDCWRETPAAVGASATTLPFGVSRLDTVELAAWALDCHRIVPRQRREATRGRKRRMSQQTLQRLRAAAVVQDVCWKGVSKQVRVEPWDTDLQAMLRFCSTDRRPTWWSRFQPKPRSSRRQPWSKTAGNAMLSSLLRNLNGSASRYAAAVLGRHSGQSLPRDSLAVCRCEPTCRLRATSAPSVVTPHRHQTIGGAKIATRNLARTRYPSLNSRHQRLSKSVANILSPSGRAPTLTRIAMRANKGIHKACTTFAPRCNSNVFSHLTQLPVTRVRLATMEFTSRSCR